MASIPTSSTIDVQSLKPFKKFIMSIGEIPTSYLESMTYAEMLVWFCDYLQNTVIPTVNNNGDAVIELQTLYNELRQYVDNYFNELDIQQEINNKLDSMAQDGSLTNLIKRYIDPIISELNDEFDILKDEVASVVSGSPAGVYPTIASLQQADPDHTRIYVVEADGNWYFYNNTTNQWKNGGVYQATLIGDASINGNEKIIDGTISDKLLDLKLPYTENYNFYKDSDAERKNANSYNTSTKLPNWTTWNSVRTITIPLTDKGYIYLSKIGVTSINQSQNFILDDDLKVLRNFNNKSITDITEFPTKIVSDIMTVNEDNLVFDCFKCSELYPDAKFLSMTYYQSDNPTIKFNGSLKPQWLYYQDAKIEHIDITLPNKLKILEGNNLVLYTQAFLNHGNNKNVSLIKIENGNTYIDNKMLVYSSTVGQLNKKISVSKDAIDIVDIEKSVNIEVVSNNAGNGLTKKVLFIGDSLTDADIYPTKVKDLFTNDNMNIELIGTRGTEYAPNEGRNGWFSYAYAHNQSFNNIDNAFFNPGTQQFDFSYYMQHNNFSGVDYVFICLGTNDIARGYNENQIIESYNLMINSIKSYNSNIKIGLWLAPNNGIGNNTNYLLSQRDKTLKVCQYLIKNYENKENENIYLIPTNAILDPDEDFNTRNTTIFNSNVMGSSYNITTISDYLHPKNSGYYKIALVFYSWIKYFGSIDE